MRLFSFKALRILLLLAALAITAFYTLHHQKFTRSWNKTLQIVVYPINGDGRSDTEQYIQSLTRKDFTVIDDWTRREAKRYDLLLEAPTNTTIGPTVDSLPPTLARGSNPWKTVWWGLKMRWWAFRHTPDNESNLERVRMFVIYQQGEKGKALPHSLGLQKGLLGVVYAYANQQQTSQNAIVIGHELLHTVGATDKYGNDGFPIFPQGFANPDKTPLYPQRKAEVMAGHRPLSNSKSRMATSLRSVVINSYTAGEINWIKQ